ncbi:MAG: 3-methyl-2-oxobutanoate hydroxymethyltransferase [Bdellovibrionales bacterium]|nr:3-methyl-2-oxobutanoate hydroxymethyltransferase [Bdellovibrionales bacterium]
MVTVPDLIRMRECGEKIIALTAYDYTFARILDQAGVHLLLVGDSLGTVFQGHSSTLPVTLEEILYHTRAVVRGTKQALIVSDLPFLSYQTGVRDALLAGGRLLKEGGAAAVKLEGGRHVAETVRAMTDAGIPVLGHIGLTPQSVHVMGGYRVQGVDEASAATLLEDAQILEASGAFGIVLEGIPRLLAAEITGTLTIPTIGIGAGPDCSGQILVLHDALGLTQFEGEPPRFVKQFGALAEAATAAVAEYRREVLTGEFPAERHCYHGKRARALKRVTPT